MSEIANELEYIRAMVSDKELLQARNQVLTGMVRYRYTYNFNWLGRPIIQLPQDMFVMQEIIWEVKPDLIIETGIAHGGSLVFYASLLELTGGDGQVLGIDVEIREHNRQAINSHPLSKRIILMEGSSVDSRIAEAVYRVAKTKRCVLVALDSMHTHAHVLRELELYADLVTKNSYCVVFDTGIEDLPEGLFPDRPWNKENNPKTAVREFLKKTDRFVVDREIEAKLLFTVAPGGYLRCVRD
jgi:cephalosporin hydroxylase